MTRTLLFFAAPLLLAATVPALAADAPNQPQRTRTALVYGDDPCPKSQGDEIVVCAREPESERYRLPKRFRGKREEPAAVSGSWANTAKSLDQASAPMMPNSCSVVGSYGQSGCMAQMLAQYRAEKKAAKAAADAAESPDE